MTPNSFHFASVDLIFSLDFALVCTIAWKCRYCSAEYHKTSKTKTKMEMYYTTKHKAKFIIKSFTREKVARLLVLCGWVRNNPTEHIPRVCQGMNFDVPLIIDSFWSASRFPVSAVCLVNDVNDISVYNICAYVWNVAIWVVFVANEKLNVSCIHL